MLVSLKWLNEYIDIKNKSIEDLENALTMIGQEVEKIEIEGVFLKNVVTAKILELEKMPQSDHLTICKIDNGSQILQVICGAPNHKKGDIVALAQVGTKFSDDFEIKKTKIRGYESNGMLCSEKELKIGDNHDGIIIFPQDTKLGLSLDKLYEKDDIIFELEITPNRPDCLSHIGIARELSAYYNIPLKKPDTSIKENILNDKKVKIISGSSRYTARIVKNVKVEKSPNWLKRYLESAGVRSINNLVDISNFVMLEYNQPIHIFDLDKLEGNITVKKLDNSIEVISLDDGIRKLEKDDIVICDDKKIVAIAGVMGLKNSEVDENTKNILIEVAHFDRLSIRKTSRRLKLSSESSYRFERGIDKDNLEIVSKRTAHLVNKLAFGDISNICDEYIDKYTEKKVELSFDRMNRFIGKNIPKDTVINILRRLEIKVIDNNDTLELTAPSFRNDLLNQYDYFEEVIRLYGFDNIENILPKLDINTNVKNELKSTIEVKRILSNMNLREAINYSFINDTGINSYNYNKEEIIKILNPVTEDFVYLRPNLAYSLIKNVKDNISRSENNIRLFEVSKVFHLASEDKNNNLVKLNGKYVKEDIHVAVILYKGDTRNILDKKEYTYYDIKEILETLFDKLHLKSFKIERSTKDIFHPGISADVLIGNKVIGSLGTLHPDITDKKIQYLEINLTELNMYVKSNTSYKPISVYPSVNRDISILVDKDVLASDIILKILKVDKNIEKVVVFDEYYEVDAINKKAIGFNILLRNQLRTLQEKEILDIMQKIEKELERNFNAKVR